MVPRNFKKSVENKEGFKYEEKAYTITDENTPNFEKIKNLMIQNNLPDIFSATKKLGKEIVPVFQIKKRKNDKIFLYFACKDKIVDYLKINFIPYSSICGDLDLEM